MDAARLQVMARQCKLPPFLEEVQIYVYSMASQNAYVLKLLLPVGSELVYSQASITAQDIHSRSVPNLRRFLQAKVDQCCHRLQRLLWDKLEVTVAVSYSFRSDRACAGQGTIDELRDWKGKS